MLVFILVQILLIAIEVGLYFLLTKLLQGPLGDFPGLNYCQTWLMNFP